MITRQQVASELTSLIEKMSSPLPDSEVRKGWSDEQVNFWKKFFIEMMSDLEYKVPVKSKYTGLVRGLDSNGILDGELFDQVVKISCQMDDLRKHEKKAWQIWK